MPIRDYFNQPQRTAGFKGDETNHPIKGRLYGKKISISVSNAMESDFSGLRYISTELARYLIINGSTILYGGDLRKGGYTRIFADLSYQYRFINNKEPRFVNYFPSKDEVSFSETELSKLNTQYTNMLFADNAGISEEKFASVGIKRDKFSAMRSLISAASDARIVLGGKQTDSPACLPGITEETFYSLKSGKPVYLMGGFGGATADIVKAIKYNSFHSPSFYSLSASGHHSRHELLEFFDAFSEENLARQNGLELWENRILFESTDLHEIASLVIKGMSTINK